MGIVPALKHENLDNFISPGKIQTELWDRLEDWHDKAVQVLDQVINKFPKYQERLKNLNIQSMKSELKNLQSLLQSIESPVVFSHNDLQYGNILKSNVNGEIILIDYEYACYNNRGFDIANHFCEWAANYHSKYPHILDFSKLPNKQQQIHFFEGYLHARNQLQKLNRVVFSESNPNSPSLSPMLTPQVLEEMHKKELEHLLIESSYFMLCSHLLWGFWGIKQASQSEIDFDYVYYAIQRIEEYSRWKNHLNLKF